MRNSREVVSRPATCDPILHSEFCSHRHRYTIVTLGTRYLFNNSTVPSSTRFSLLATCIVVLLCIFILLDSLIDTMCSASNLYLVIRGLCWRIVQHSTLRTAFLSAATCRDFFPAMSPLVPGTCSTKTWYYRSPNRAGTLQLVLNLLITL